MKRYLLLLIAIIYAINYIYADISITVPKKWKGRTVYVWQTDINQSLSKQRDEPIHQVKDTVKIKDLTFILPIKLDCATMIKVLSPKKDESDFDHTIAEACVMPGEDVHLYLNENEVSAEGSLLNQQMSEIYTYYMQTMVPFLKAYSKGDQEEVSRIVRESVQWYTDWIKTNSSSPAAGAALKQISKPELVIELSDVLQGDALTSIYYPYAVQHINRSKLQIERKNAQQSINEQSIDAPNFTLTDLTGNQVSLTDFWGKWVILDFWGSWCSPCLKGMPELKDIYETYSGKIEIIGVDCNDTRESWINAVTRLELPWVQLIQTESDNVTSAYSVTAYPTKVVIDPTGKIKKIYSGASPTFKEDLEVWLK